MFMGIYTFFPERFSMMLEVYKAFSMSCRKKLHMLRDRDRQTERA